MVLPVKWRFFFTKNTNFLWFSYGFSTPKPRLGDLGAQAPAAPLDLWPSLDAAGGVDQSGGGLAARGGACGINILDGFLLICGYMVHEPP